MAKGAQQMTRQAALMSFCQNGKLGDLTYPCQSAETRHEHIRTRKQG